MEAFRAEFAAFLDARLPVEADVRERSRSSAHVPDWARRWQCTLFDHGWLLPGQPPGPGSGGRNAGLPQSRSRQIVAPAEKPAAFREKAEAAVAAASRG